MEGRPLEPGVRADMESRFGQSFGHVRVHDGDQAGAAAAIAGANAYTVGSDVVFGAGRYTPGSPAGRALLAHELAHVVQQGRGGPAGEAALERDAARASTAPHPTVEAASEPRLSRQAADEDTGDVWLVEISCAINEIRFHTQRRVVSYHLTECDLDEGEYDAQVVVDRRHRTVRFDLGANAPEGVRFHFNYLVGPDQPSPLELLRHQTHVDVVATNLPPRTNAPPPPQVAPDLHANVQHVSPEMGMELCQSGAIHVKTFPFRATRFGAAPIDAWRDGDYIRVKQPVYVLANDDFRAQTRTLPTETFTEGVRLYPDEIVRVHIYEDPWWKPNVTGSTDWTTQREVCVTGEQMLEIARASTNATLLNIGVTVVEAGTFFVPVGRLAAPLLRAGRTGLAAAMIGTADIAPTALAGAASRTGTTLVEQRAESQIVSRAVEQSVERSVSQTVTQSATHATETAVPRVAGGSIAAPVATGVATTGVDVGGTAAADTVTSSALAPIEGATEVRLSQAEYESALRLVFPAQFADELAVTVDELGSRAAARALQDARFVAAVQSGNWTMAGTLFHSAAAQEARAIPAAALPAGWRLSAERVIQSGAGGSRADIFLEGPAGQIVEFDWKTSGRSALSYGSRREMTRHAGQITVNIGGQLTRQESRSWIDYVRPLMPGVNW